MSSPVTHDEFRREIDRLDRRLDTILDHIDARFTSQEQRYDERFVKIDERFARIDERFDSMEKRFDSMERRFVSILAELRVDLARHANAIQENVAQQIRVIDDKYKDLPGRVAALEAAPPVHPPPRRRAR